jgi:glycine betaine catabolism A
MFVRCSAEGPPLGRHLGALDEMLRPYATERFFVGASHEYHLRCNWKIVAENYQECYHCSEIHPELCRISPPTSGEACESDGLWIGGTMDLRSGADTMSLTGESLGVPAPGLDGRRLHEVIYIGVFPNLLLSVHPDYIMTHRLEPVGVDETFITCEWLFPPEAKQRSDFVPSYAVDFWDLTNRQDWAACEAVQRGVAGRGYRQAPLSLQETQVYELISMVARGYLEGEARPVPPELQAFTRERRAASRHHEPARP